MLAVFHPYTLLLAASALVSITIALMILGRWKARGAIPLTVLMLELAIWAIAYGAMWSLRTLEGQILWLELTYCAVLAVPLTFLIFVIKITDNDHWLTVANVLLLSLEPLAAFFFIWTAQYHSLFFSSFRQVNINGFPEISWTRGPWFWVNTFYSYVLLTAAIVMLVRAFLRAGPYSRVQFATILIGCFLPWGINIYSVVFPNSLRNFDLTPVSFAASGAILAYALLRQRLLDIVPIARSMVIEKMTDGVLVLDLHGRILDANPVARRMMPIEDDPFGKDIYELYPQWKNAIELSPKDKELRFEIRSRANPSAFYDVTTTALFDSRGHENGHLISFRDITERKRAEEELQKINGRLQKQVQKISALRDELREQAIRDPLTGLFNRRYLTETFERELDRAQRESYPVSVIMMDVDRFKRVNDTHGHKAGDLVLKSLGEIVRVHIRGSDIPCRFGGEEFLIVLPETGLETAVQRAEHIRTHFQSMKFFKGKNGVSPTLSIGIAGFPDNGKKADRIMSAADQALYSAKACGGNKAIKSTIQSQGREKPGRATKPRSRKKAG